MKLLFVVNPKSGNKEFLTARLSELAEKQRYKYKFVYTKGESDPERISETMKDYQPETVVASGGDGTINMVATLLIDKGIPLGIIPTGSANGLAFNLDIPRNIEKAFSRIVENNPKPLDVIRFNKKHHCFHLADTGINARVVKRFEKEGSKGIMGYARQFLKEIFSKSSPFRVYLNIKGKKKKYHAEILLIANATSFGTGVPVNPTGEFDDGKFEIVVIKSYSWWYPFIFVFSYLTKKLYSLENVRIFSTNRATINFKSTQVLQIDGEILDDVKSLEVDILHNQLKVFY